MGQLIFITGGRRSGKSSCALELAESMGSKRLYIATAQALDVEMEERISRHRIERGDGWETVEEPVNVAEVVAKAGGQSRFYAYQAVNGTVPPAYDVILVDCLTLWLCNVMYEKAGDCPRFTDEAERSRRIGTVPSDSDNSDMKKIDMLVEACKTSKTTVIAVSNELGSGVIPDNSLSRRFSDLAGIMNQKMAAAADKVILTVSGIPMTIKDS